MGCGNCGSGASGKPGGCKGNGGCSTGGCNRMNVFDWLSALPLYDSAKPYPIIEVSFSKGSRKDFFKNNTNHILEKGQWIAVEGISGYDIGQVSLTGELVKLQLKKYGIEDQNALKRVLHPATEDELKNYEKNKLREPEVLLQSRAMARSHKLEMKLAEVEIQADGKKGTFFYTADQRVDFRELIKAYASEFKLKVEMRQIGARQESAKVGGIGSCGRELCCSTWLSDFKSVNTTAARYQNLSINQTKLSGQCGRLKCCLNYELDTYMDALRVFPDNAEQIETVKGRATLQKRDIFKNLMWYSYSDSNKQYPMTIVRVKEILKLNKEGIKPEELQPVELETGNKAGVLVDVGFVNDVGQITLRSLEKGSKNKKKQGTNKSQQQAAPGQQQSRPQQGNRPQQGPKPAQGAAGAAQPRQRPEQGQRPKPQQGGSQQAPKQAQGAGQQGQKPRPPQGPRPERGPQQPRPERGPQQPRPERTPRPNNNQNRNRDRPKPPDTKPAE